MFTALALKKNQRFDDLVELGCIACNLEGFGYTRPEIHHLRDGQGMSQRAPDDETIPLCPIHHRTGLKSNATKEFAPSFHLHRKVFTERYGSERELLDQVNDAIEEMYMSYGGTE